MDETSIHSHLSHMQHKTLTDKKQIDTSMQNRDREQTHTSKYLYTYTNRKSADNDKQTKKKIKTDKE